MVEWSDPLPACVSPTGIPGLLSDCAKGVLRLGVDDAPPATVSGRFDSR